MVLCNFYFSEDNHLIEEASYSGIVTPSSDWHTLEWKGSSASIAYRVRVQCQANYYNATCTELCRPRNDTFGHYTCGSLGDKQCLPGWSGTTCDKREYSILF